MILKTTYTGVLFLKNKPYTSTKQNLSTFSRNFSFGYLASTSRFFSLRTDARKVVRGRVAHQYQIKHKMHFFHALAIVRLLLYYLAHSKEKVNSRYRRAETPRLQSALMYLEILIAKALCTNHYI